MERNVDSNFYEIWKYKNRIVFKNERVDALEIFTLTQLNAWT